MRNALLGVAAAVAAISALGLFVEPSWRPMLRREEGTLTGTVEARQIDVASLVGGRIARREADEGAQVQAGDVLCVIEDDEIRLRIARLEARKREADATVADLRSLPRKEDLAWQRSRVAEAEVALEKAQKDLDRLRQMDPSSVPGKDLDETTSAHRLAEQRLETARRELARVEAGARPHQIDAAEAAAAELARSLDLARLELARTRVTAPIAGAIQSRNYEFGELVPAGAPLFTLVDLSELWIELSADERLHGSIVLGQSVELRPEPFPDRTAAGRVSFIADRHRFTPRNVLTRDERSKLTFRVKVQVEDPPPYLKPGMFVDVSFPEDGRRAP